MQNLATIKKVEIDYDDLYKLLNINEDATDKEIRAAYKKMAGTYHPDKETGDEELFKAIKQAYEILINPAARQAYDATGIYKGDEAEDVKVATEAVRMSIKRIIDEYEDTENIDIVSELKEDIIAGIKSCNIAIRKISKRLAMLNKNKKRAKGLTLIAFNEIIEKAEKNLKEAEEDKNLFEISSKIIKTCVYNFEKEQEVSSYLVKISNSYEYEWE